jgi:hypothetical protein
MTVTGKHVETVLRSIPGAYGRQVASLDTLAAGANEALLAAPDGLTVKGAAAFLATMSQESASFRTTEEYAKNGRYAPYIGRTFEQITWESNYRAFGVWCNLRGLVADSGTFVNNPKSLADIKWAWLGGIWFWEKNGIWPYGNKGDFLATQRAVNLGNPNSSKTPNGITARRAWYDAWLKIGADLLPVTSDPTPTPNPNPPEPLMHSSKWGSDYVSFRGGYVPPVVRDMLLAIPSSVTLSQGGLSTSVSASANTHAGLGAYDVKVSGWSKAAILKICSELISCGECAFPRGPRWGSPSFAEHVHVCSNNAYDSLHPEAQAQVRDFKHNPRRNGLVGHGAYVGPSTLLGRWSDSPWNPVNIAKKELELPTTAEVAKALATDKTFLAAVADAVLNSDSIPNAGVLTSNVDNVNVSTKTALSQLGKKSNDISAKLDALIARFPEPEPTPPAA